MAKVNMENVQKGVGLALLVLMPINLYNIFIFVPTEKTMGIVQRIFYFHVPSFAAAFVAFLLVAVSSGLFLRTRNFVYDRFSYAAAEIGVLFTTAGLITGPIWAKPAWNTWWSWDARLTTTLVLWFIYVAYLMLRNFAGAEERGARFAAVYAIVGFVDVPIVYFSIRWWRTIHPQPVLMGGKGSGLHPDMLYTLMFSMGVFLVLFIYLLLARLRLEQSRRRLFELKQEIAFQD